MTAARWEDRGEERWIQLSGELDHDGCDEVRSAFLAAAGEANGEVVVDMSRVSFVSSQGIWMLLQVHKQLQGTGRRLLVRSMQPHVHKVLDTVGVFKAIPEWDERAERDDRPV